MSQISNIAFVMEIITERAVAFFREELQIEVRHISCNLKKVKKLELGYLTSLLVMEGRFKVYLAFSFEKPLIEQAFEIYSEDIEVAEDERNEYIEETAGDIINIIVGNATARLPAGGPAVTLSPPVVISEAKSIFCHKEAQFYTASLDTQYGRMDIYCIGPKELAGDQI